MRCKCCGSSDSKVIDSRPTEGGSVIRRRRQCTQCGHRFTTYEREEALPVLVVKRDSSLQSFNKDKIRRGVVKACEKRPVSPEIIDDVVEAVEREVRTTGQQEISSQAIGDMVLDALLPVDPVAYIRFASVYRSFQNIGEFMEELKRLSDRQDMGNAENTKVTEGTVDLG